MLQKQDCKNIVQYVNDTNDNFALTKTVFEWFRTVFVTFAILTIIFSFIFRVTEVSIFTENKEISVTVLALSNGYRPNIGDNVVVYNKNGNYIAVVLAYDGQVVTANSKNNEISVDFVVCDSRLFPNANLFEEKYGDFVTVPEGKVLVKCDGKNNTEIISLKDIAGKVNSVIYPINYLGKNISDIKR